MCFFLSLVKNFGNWSVRPIHKYPENALNDTLFDTDTQSGLVRNTMYQEGQHRTDFTVDLLKYLEEWVHHIGRKRIGRMVLKMAKCGFALKTS